MLNDTLVLTLLGANNIGAFLQAFSMQEVLKENGYSPKFAIIPVSATTGNKNGKFSKIIRYLKQGDVKKLLYKINIGKKYSAARSNIATCKLDTNKHYERVIIGSDEVWNVASNKFYHHPQYFGKELNATRLVSYAPSAGNSTSEDIKAQGLDFSKFTALSARDNNTYEIVKAIDGRTPELVVDPTFLMTDFSKYEKDCACEKDFIMVYSYGISKENIKKVKAFAKEKGLPLYSVGTYNSWCNKNIQADPFEFLYYLRKAKYVVTSTFHGTALSLNLNKEFVVLADTSKKLLSLLDSFSVSDRNAANADNVSDIFENKIDYDKVNKYMRVRREESLKFLFDGLSE